MVETPHTGEKLASVIKNCLLKWNIDRKLFSITLDNCSTNDIMVTKLIEWLLEKDALVCNDFFFQVRYAAHILNLVVLDDVKEIIKYPTSNIFFKEFCEIKMEIEKMCSSSGICLSNMAMKMKTKFDKYMNICNLILAVAVIFNHHYKIKIIEFFYRQFYKDEVYEYVYAIKNYHCDLYDEYKATYALKTLSTCTSYIVDVEMNSDASSFTSLIEFSSNKKPKTCALDDFLEESSQSQCTKSDFKLYLEEPIYSKNNSIDILT
ncbi:Zinc finger BED domain-containing protein RICESLEEPER 1 [Nymphaea thermarum]|nr:Zinc finger BED domain-containing protein RICESLEEPER 1 [Nymphaea thermarum]